MSETTYNTYGQWLNALEAITRQELGLDLRDLPDVRTFEDYEARISPEDAFQNYCADHWQDFDPEQFLIGGNIEDIQNPDSYDLSDADPGL